MNFFNYCKKATAVKTVLWMGGEAIGNLLLAWVVSQFVLAATTRDLSRFWQTLFVGSIGFAFVGCVRYCSKMTQVRVIREVNQRIKTKVLASMLPDVRGREEIVSFITNDLKQFETSGIQAELNMVSACLTVTAALVGAVLYDPLMTAIFLGTAFLPILVNRCFKGKIAEFSEKWQAANQRMLTMLKNVIGGYRTLKTYGVYGNQLEKVQQQIRTVEDYYAQMNGRVQLADSIMMTVAWIGSVTLPFGLGMYLIIQQQLSLASFMGVVQLSNSFINPLLTFFQMRNQKATTRKIEKKLKERFHVKVKHSGTLQFEQIEELVLDKVSVLANDQTRLPATTLLVRRGEKLLLRAPSGYGKSTILALLQGQLPLSSGRYLVNQVPIETVDPDWLQSQFGCIQQNPYIFAGSLRFNLTLGEEYSEEELAMVINATSLETVIQEKGWDYPLEQTGNSLSGGQIERLELARALLRKRPFLIVDEGTAALDSQTTSEIRATLMRYPGTIIEVAHKVQPEEAALFDRILDLGCLHGTNGS